jgi:hypothetical protein
MGFNPAKRKRHEEENVGDVYCSHYLNRRRPPNPEETLLYSRNDEFLRKINASLATFTSDVLVERPADVPEKRCLRALQYVFQIGSAEVLQTLKQTLMENTSLPNLPFDYSIMVFLQLDFIQKIGKDHLGLARKRWEQYYLYETFDNAVRVEREKKKRERKARGKHKNPMAAAEGCQRGHQTAEYVVRQRIFEGMKAAIEGQLHQSAGGHLSNFDQAMSNRVLSEDLLSANLLNGKKIARFFMGYERTIFSCFCSSQGIKFYNPD